MTDGPRSLDAAHGSDGDLDDLVRRSVPQLDLVRFMHLTEIDLPAQDLPDQDLSDQDLPGTASFQLIAGDGPPTEVRRTLRSARPTRPARLAGLIGVAAALVALGLYLGSSSDPESRLSVTGSDGESTTTIIGTAFGPHVNPVEHLIDVADRSLALRSELGDLTPAVDTLIHQPLVPKELSVGDYFPPPSFPALAPLPGRTAWIFFNPKIHSQDNPCAVYAPRSITMTGFAGPAWISDTAYVSVVTYTLTGPAEASDFFAGRSLQLGALEGECVADTSGEIVVNHRGLALNVLPTGVDQWNSWTFSAPDPLLPDETGAYGFLLRRGDQISEVRVGVKNNLTLTPAQLSEFVAAVMG